MIKLGAVAIGFVSMALALATPALAGPLHDAASAGDRALLASLLRGGAAIDERDETGATPLIAAALAGNGKIIDQLLVAGADASIRDKSGLSVLHAAATGGDAEGVHLLLGEGPFAARVEINERENERGITPLIAAVEANEGDIVAYLVSLGADKEIVDKDGHTALTIAGKKAYDELVTILLTSGALCQEIDPAWFAECSKRKAEMGL
jgi:uncharacterized protein